MDFTAAQQKEISKLTQKINTAIDNLEREISSRNALGLTYEQKRIEKKLLKAKKNLKELDTAYNTKKDLIEAEYQRALLKLEEQTSSNRCELEEVISDCQAELDKDSPGIVYCKAMIEIARKNRAQYIEQCANYSSSQPSASPSNREQEAMERIKEAAKRREEQEKLERKREAEREANERIRQQEEKRLKDLEAYKQQKAEEERRDLERWNRQREEELQSSNTQNEKTIVCSEEEVQEEEKEESEDVWDLTDTTAISLRQRIRAAIRQGIEPPQHVLDYLEQLEIYGQPQKKKSSTLELPPPAINKPSPQVEKRQPVKQIKGVHSYPPPEDD